MGRVFDTVCDPACHMHCMISKHNGCFFTADGEKKCKAKQTVSFCVYSGKKLHYRNEIICCLTLPWEDNVALVFVHSLVYLWLPAGNRKLKSISHSF